MSNIITIEGAGFSSLPNELLNHAKISLAAKALYAFMRGKPSNWNFTIRSMAKQLKEGETAITTALNELKQFGWLSYVKRSDGKGVYHLFWSPQTETGASPKPENPVLDEPEPEKPNQGFTMKGKSQRISNKEPIVKQIDKKERAQSTLPFSMSLDWQPDAEQLKPRAVMSGLKIEAFTAEVIGEFKIHYEASGRSATNAQWLASLISWVKRNHAWSAKAGADRSGAEKDPSDISWIYEAGSGL